jgi:hypothetical protein
MKMNPAIEIWTDSVVKVVTVFATTVIALYVAQISKRQLENNREKLRLDLYQRRFEIYLRVLEYHWALVDWQGKPEQIASRGPFVRAFCESRFIFPEKSGVYDFLREFNLHAVQIVNFKSERDEKGGATLRQNPKFAQLQIDNVTWMLNSPDALYARMAPFLNFHSL